MSTMTRAWVASGGTNVIVLTRGDMVWMAEGEGFGDAATLCEALAGMAAGEWEPNEGDGWTLASAPFDPEAYLGWTWTEVGTSLDDLTWSDMVDAGIDIDNVNRGDPLKGDNWYECIDGDRRVVFGPAEDHSEGTTFGWDICTYVRFPEDGGWDDIHQNWEPTKERMLRYVKAEIS